LDFCLWGAGVRNTAIAATLAFGTFCLVQVNSAQDRPLGDVARETRARTAQSKPAKTLTSDGPETAVTASDDPLEVITKAATAMLRDNSHRCHEMASGNSGPRPGWTQVVTTEFAGDDRMRVVADQGDQPSEMIMIGKQGYRKLGNGPWAKIDPMEMAWYQTYAPNALKLPDELKFGYKPGDVKLIGPEVIKGVSTFHYQFKVRDSFIDRTVDIWVGAGDRLPRKTEMMTYDPKMGTSWHTTTECTYGIEIKIEAPM